MLDTFTRTSWPQSDWMVDSNAQTSHSSMTVLHAFLVTFITDKIPLQWDKNTSKGNEKSNGRCFVVMFVYRRVFTGQIPCWFGAIFGDGPNPMLASFRCVTRGPKELVWLGCSVLLACRMASTKGPLHVPTKD